MMVYKRVQGPVMELQNIHSPAITPVILISILVMIVYSNSFDNSWHLDDYVRIPANTNIQMNELSFKSIADSIFLDSVDASGRIHHQVYRPLVNLSFALNWFFHKDNVRGYHAVSIFIHILTTVALYFSILYLFKTPALEHVSQDTAFFSAFFTAVLWAVHPINTQAVNYLVQRMALMSALFYLSGIMFYLKAKHSGTTTKKKRLYALAVVSFFLAIGSKENAVTFPLAIFLLEIIFFKRSLSLGNRRLWIRFSICMIVISAVAAAVLYTWGFSLPTMQTLYEKRSFTMLERALTQPRILLFYLSLIFYPVASRFSIEHDYVLSTSLFNPISPVSAIIAIAAIISAAMIVRKRAPLVSLGILFFFLAQMVESSIL
ncbi:MAG: hypothetical protein V1793_21055, partial [Pseudomonadota bacterium]